MAEPYAELTRPAVEGNPHMAGAYSILAALSRSVAGDETTVVDVGCGPGWWVEHLTRQNVRAAGVDLSPAMIDLARAHVPQATFQVGSVLDLPLPTRTMSGVACMYVLHHVPDHCLQRAIAELERVLAPGGVLLIGGHTGDSHTIKTRGYGDHTMNVQINRRPAATWENLVRTAGLTIEAHTIYDPDKPSSSHALFARTMPTPTH